MPRATDISAVDQNRCRPRPIRSVSKERASRPGYVSASAAIDARQCAGGCSCTRHSGSGTSRCQRPGTALAPMREAMMSSQPALSGAKKCGSGATEEIGKDFATLGAGCHFRRPIKVATPSANLRNRSGRTRQAWRSLPVAANVSLPVTGPGGVNAPRAAMRSLRFPPAKGPQRHRAAGRNAPNAPAANASGLRLRGQSALPARDGAPRHDTPQG